MKFKYVDGIQLLNCDLVVQINPQTLKYSFDNGESWFSESEMQNIIDSYNFLSNTD